MKVYTDGACSGNPGPGGWAWAVPEGPQGSGGEAHSTNQRMELQAVLEALKALEGEVHVVSDSTYVVNCFNDRWYEGWIARGWRTAAKKPVANQDLWQPLVELYLERSDEITFEWVKGHSGNTMNDLVDELAVAAAAVFKEDQPDKKKTATLVRETPLPAEALPAALTLEPPVPWSVGSAVWVVGPTTLRGSKSLESVVARLDPASDILVTGLRRGAELVAGEVALSSGIQIGAVLPFNDPAAGWPDDERERFDVALAAASWVVTLPGEPTRPGSAVRLRDEWCRQAVLGAIVVGMPEDADVLETMGLSVVRVDEG